MNNPKLTIFIIVLAFAALTGFTLSGIEEAPGVSAWATKKSYKPGESGTVTIKFKTPAGVKIPKEPEISVNLTGNSVEGKGLQDYTRGAGEYLSNSTVNYNFLVPKNVKSGSTLTLKGKVKFGYCTTKDGVCRIGTQEFSAKIKVR
jgi:ABC-type Fe3+-hydroxamate transport system substrate-binding protein